MGCDSGSGDVVAATVPGVLSTISSGGFPLLTAPAWIIVGSVAAEGQAGLAVTELSPTAWGEIARFARLPGDAFRSLVGVPDAPVRDAALASRR